MNADNDLTFEIVSRVLEYDPITGKLRWKPRPDFKKNWNSRFPGTEAGCVKDSGYVVVRINHRKRQAHRIVWLLHFGEFPKKKIDHINGNPSDNRICNLRECTDSENHENKGIQKNNKSGYTGVSTGFKPGYWIATINKNRKQFYLGQFPTKEMAYAAYLVAKAEKHTFQPTPRNG